MEKSYQNDMLLKWEKQSILHRETTGTVIYILSRIYE
jgi:hypothetical protein